MKAIEFCYWLQGYFELSEVHGAAAVVPRPGVACIRAHLELVRKVDSAHEIMFVEWLDSHLQTIDRLDSIACAKVKRMLAAQFKHVIDPSYAGDAKELQKIHDAPHSDAGPDGLVMRC